jgi:predicted RNase H-like HicB family nuclease
MIQAADPCKRAAIATSFGVAVAAYDFPARSFIPGTRLNVSVAIADLDGLQTSLIPLQGVETRPLAELVQLTKSGSYSLALLWREAEKTQTCVLLPQLDVRCGEGEQEVDGQWLAKVTELPGVMAYGATDREAVEKAEALALRALADRLEHGEIVPELREVFALAR